MAAKYTYESPFDEMSRKNWERRKIEAVQDADRAAIEKVAPGRPYYQPAMDEAPDRALTRAKAQGEYMKRRAGPSYQQDEGVFADTVRGVRNAVAGKRGADILEHGDADLMEGARAAGREAVADESAAEMRRESKGKAYKKGGRVTGYRGYGIAKKV